MKAAIVAVFFVLILVSFARGDDLVIQVGDSRYSRALPEDLTEAQDLLRGMTGLLNEVIDAYEKDSALAQAQVKQILASADIVADKVDQGQGLLNKVDPTRFAKIVALGGYLDVNPVPGLGGLRLGLGPSLSYNVFNWALVRGHFGISIDQQAQGSGSQVNFRFDTGVGLEFWLF